MPIRPLVCMSEEMHYNGRDIILTLMHHMISI